MSWRNRAVFAILSSFFLITVLFQNCGAKKLPEAAQASTKRVDPPLMSVASLRMGPGDSRDLTVVLANFTKAYTFNWRLAPDDGLFAGTTSGTVNVIAGQLSFNINLRNKAIVGSGSKTYSVTISDASSELSNLITTVYVDDPGVPSSLSVSYIGSCAAVNGVAKCWGSNNYGELSTADISTGHKTPQAVEGLPALPVIKVAHNVQQSCAIVLGGALYCWGRNDYGQLGDGTNRGRRTPALVAGLETGVTEVALGWLSACAIKDGKLFCWGYNGYGQLGIGTTETKYAATEVTALGSSVTAVSVGKEFACAVAGGAVKCFGRNSYGQLGDGTTSNRYSPVAVAGAGSGATQVSTGGYHSCAVVNGEVRCWGYNGEGELGDNGNSNRSAAGPVANLPTGATQVVSGDRHSCALINGGAVYCWGWNSGYGALGIATSTNISRVPVQVNGLRAGTVRLATGPAIADAASHTCAISAANEIQCWGYNGYGQIGNDSTANQITPSEPISF